MSQPFFRLESEDGHVAQVSSGWRMILGEGVGIASGHKVILLLDERGRKVNFCIGEDKNIQGMSPGAKNKTDFEDLALLFAQVFGLNYEEVIDDPLGPGCRFKAP